METIHEIKADKNPELAALEMQRLIIEQAPMATCIWAGKDLVIETANDVMLRYWGKDRSVIGKPLAEAIPEIKGQPFLDILAEIYRTGVSHSDKEALAYLKVDGILRPFYFNFTYKPFRNHTGAIHGIMNMAIDVTEQVMARHKLEEAEQSMRGAVELANLGVWSIDIATNGLVYSDQMIEWFGFNPDASDFNEAIPILGEQDQQRVAKAVTWAMNPDSNGIFDEVYTVENKITGEKRILHSLGKTVFDISGKPLRINGTAQDITLQRQSLLELENEVQRRTEQLAAINDQLQRTNEELAAANTQLMQSNEELAQYAYVASHDLQEPLRKISTYTSIIHSSPSLPELLKSPAEKIMNSSRRMSMLIRDLLDFSTLLKPNRHAAEVNLNNTIQAIIGDFELAIQEAGAMIKTDPLPTIEAMSLQMNQLFYNLFSNATKFRRKDVDLRITITSHLMAREEISQHLVKPIPGVNYFHITFMDNGIGFDSQYTERIFEVFKRLHGREAYPGSGIGLALCRKIVTNHQGVLYAESVAGEGSAFHIILPDRQEIQKA